MRRPSVATAVAQISIVLEQQPYQQKNLPRPERQTGSGTVARLPPRVPVEPNVGKLSNINKRVRRIPVKSNSEIYIS